MQPKLRKDMTYGASGGGGGDSEHDDVYDRAVKPQAERYVLRGEVAGLGEGQKMIVQLADQPPIEVTENSHIEFKYPVPMHTHLSVQAHQLKIELDDLKMETILREAEKPAKVWIRAYGEEDKEPESEDEDAPPKPKEMVLQLDGKVTGMEQGHRVAVVVEHAVDVDGKPRPLGEDFHVDENISFTFPDRIPPLVPDEEPEPVPVDAEQDPEAAAAAEAKAAEQAAVAAEAEAAAAAAAAAAAEGEHGEAGKEKAPKETPANRYPLFNATYYFLRVGQEIGEKDDVEGGADDGAPASRPSLQLTMETVKEDAPDETLAKKRLVVGAVSGFVPSAISPDVRLVLNESKRDTVIMVS
jgi:hypothetical protein